MDTNEQEPVHEWNQALPIRIIKRLSGPRAGGVLSPHSERVRDESNKEKAARQAADEEAPSQHDKDKH